ncbi:MAG TPA: metal-dependent transcriptional regulator [Victivallales bacterium]|nr:metal-dependent transcriptional regulator [Victivallales bacterium]
MKTKAELSASLEDYIEVIYETIEGRSAVRPKDIAKKLKVSYASVTGALRALSEKGMINYVPHDIITLTPEGKKAAKSVTRSHGIIKDFLVKVLGMEMTEADNEACRLEHAMSDTVLKKFAAYLDFCEECPECSKKWKKSKTGVTTEKR